jgi:pyruvate dehydrogenase E2 component (dihydrolipoamide acetyltransferase)
MNSTRRKLAIATWGAPDEGNIYGKLTVDATELIKFIEHVRQKTGEKVTVTHLVGKAVALGLAKAPGLNGRIAWGTYYPHATVDIAYLVALDDGADLAKVKIAQMDQKPVSAVAAELRQRAEKLRQGKDSEFEKSKGMLRALPSWLIRPILKLTGWLTGSLGISMPALGLEAHPFGSCIVTSVGMLGIDEAFAPHTPFAQVPVLVLVGAVREAAVVQDGAIVARAQLTITATIDHRYVDGFQLATVAKTIRATLENPWDLTP